MEIGHTLMFLKDKVHEGSKSALLQKFMIFWYAVE